MFVHADNGFWFVGKQQRTHLFLTIAAYVFT